MRIYEALIVICFIFHLILCDPVKDLVRMTSRQFENKTNATNGEKPSEAWRLNVDDNDAKYSLLEKKCKSVTSAPGEILHSGCPKPKHIKNGIWSCSEDGLYCQTLCQEGYKLIHHSKAFIKCRNKQWNGNPEDFRCTCDFNYIPDNAESLSCSGHSCQVTCKAGYSAPLLTEMTYLEEAWSIPPESLACNSNQSCQIPTPPEHGIWLCKLGDCSCELSCAEGYRPSDGREISYDLSQNQWSVEPSTFSCIATEAHVVLLTGGGGTEKSVEVFDPKGRCNIDLPDLPVGRLTHTAHHIIKNGDVLLCGGWSNDGRSSCSKLVGQSFVHHSNLVEPRMHHSGVVLGNKIYLVGGLLMPNRNGMSSMESLTDTSVTWSKENVQLEEERFATCIVATSNTTFLVIGGASQAHRKKITLIEKTQVGEFNSTTQTWTTLAPMLGGGRYGHSCLNLGNGLVLVAGGQNGPTKNDVLSNAEIYNINKNTWISMGSLNKTRAWGALVKANGRIFFIGGEAELKTSLDTVEEFHPRRNLWTLLESRLKRPRMIFGATSVPKTYIGC